jgi:hypothetical protein
VYLERYRLLFGMRLNALDWPNFFLADVRGGLGAYLNVFLLTKAQWSQAAIGAVLMTSGLIGIMAHPAVGAFIDHTGRSALVIAGTFLLSGCGLVIVSLPVIPVVLRRRLRSCCRGHNPWPLREGGAARPAWPQRRIRSCRQCLYRGSHRYHWAFLHNGTVLSRAPICAANNNRGSFHSSARHRSQQGPRASNCRVSRRRASGQLACDDPIPAASNICGRGGAVPFCQRADAAARCPEARAGQSWMGNASHLGCHHRCPACHDLDGSARHPGE